MINRKLERSAFGLACQRCLTVIPVKGEHCKYFTRPAVQVVAACQLAPTFPLAEYMNGIFGAMYTAVLCYSSIGRILALQDM
jgi:hypothetical protein